MGFSILQRLQYVRLRFTDIVEKDMQRYEKKWV